jgi:hypothetical protein
MGHRSSHRSLVIWGQNIRSQRYLLCMYIEASANESKHVSISNAAMTGVRGAHEQKALAPTTTQPFSTNNWKSKIYSQLQRSFSLRYVETPLLCLYHPWTMITAVLLWESYHLLCLVCCFRPLRPIQIVKSSQQRGCRSFLIVTLTAVSCGDSWSYGFVGSLFISLFKTQISTSLFCNRTALVQLSTLTTEQ